MATRPALMPFGAIATVVSPVTEGLVTSGSRLLWNRKMAICGPTQPISSCGTPLMIEETCTTRPATTSVIVTFAEILPAKSTACGDGQPFSGLSVCKNIALGMPGMWYQPPCLFGREPAEGLP